ncbi:DUF6153 family protein [Micromonospora chersina]|uniref:Uncharacterized protein n=1 Tax=Micromonospora chersina TaxID=47854 RepID=A0A1C6V8E0_9ACTN|nr:DUF6153 family protein [Micromonospora chersina]SCL62622.1 hypothetical protein GA0070603_3439 [Micromonospora chersina]
MAGTAATGRWVRLLLLVCTLVGLTAMHTLGHGAHSPSGQPAGHPAGHSAALAMVADCEGDRCTARALPPGDPGADPSGWSVCLAVLGAFAVALLVVVLLRTGSRSAVAAAGGPLRHPAGPRAPPPRAFGLRLATTSVLRR